MRRYDYDTINRWTVLLALGWWALIGFTLDPAIDDFARYWQASVDFLRYGDPYVTRQDYFYPPFFAYLMQPFGLLRHEHGQWMWFILNSCVLCGFIGLCLKVSGGYWAHRYWGVVVLGTLLAPPTRLSLQLGQVSIMVALMLLGVCVLAQHKPRFAGFLLALSSLIRINPAFMGIYYLFHRPRIVAWWSMACSAALLGLSLLVYGANPYMSYINTIVWQNIAQKGDYPFAAEHNISVAGFWYRLLSPSRHALPLADMPLLAQILTFATGLIVFGLCVLVLRMPSPASQKAEENVDAEQKNLSLLQFSVWLCGMMLLWPTNGYYNLVILPLPILAVMRHLEHHPNRPIRNWLIIATVLACIPPGWSKVHPILYKSMHTEWGLFLLTPSLYGLCLFMGILALCVKRVHTLPTPPSSSMAPAFPTTTIFKR